MNRFLLVLATLCAAFGLAAQASDSLDFPQPQFMNPIYDSFSRNYYSTSAMGRGYTGIALPGETDNALLNPAAYLSEKASLHLEMLIKPPVNVNYYGEDDNLTSPAPFGIVAAGTKLGEHFSGALLYSLPKTLHLDDFSIDMNMGYYLLMRYPTFNLHQLTANAAWHSGDFHVGLNLHNQFYYLSDITILRTFERIRDAKYVLRPQLGLLYSGEKINAGLTVTPPQDLTWKFKDYVTYDTTLPLNAAFGAACKLKKTSFTGEVEFEQCSAISDAYSDRVNVRLGAETTIRRFSYRAGYIYSPEVWHGYYRLPMNNTANADSAIWWGDVAPGGYLGKNTQHILTVGTSWHHQDVNVNLGFLMDVAGKAPVAQVNASIDLYFSAFKNKKFLYFD
jgi:hypothetical protein